MTKNLMLALFLFVSCAGLTCATGCYGKEDVVQGTATDKNFESSTDVDDKGRKVPTKGIGVTN